MKKHLVLKGIRTSDPQKINLEIPLNRITAPGYLFFT